MSDYTRHPLSKMKIRLVRTRPDDPQDHRYIVASVQRDGSMEVPVEPRSPTTLRIAGAFTQFLILAHLLSKLQRPLIVNSDRVWWLENHLRAKVIEAREDGKGSKTLAAMREVLCHAHGDEERRASLELLLRYESRGDGLVSYKVHDSAHLDLAFYDGRNSPSPLSLSRLAEILIINNNGSDYFSGRARIAGRVDDIAEFKRLLQWAKQLEPQSWINPDRRQFVHSAKAKLLVECGLFDRGDVRESIMDFPLATQTLEHSGNNQTRALSEQYGKMIPLLADAVKKNGWEHVPKILMHVAGEDLLSGVSRIQPFPLLRDCALELLGDRNPEKLRQLTPGQYRQHAEVTLAGKKAVLWVALEPWAENSGRERLELYPAPAIALVPQSHDFQAALRELQETLMRSHVGKMDFCWGLDCAHWSEVPQLDDLALTQKLADVLTQCHNVKFVKPKTKLFQDNARAIPTPPREVSEQSPALNYLIPKPDDHFSGANRLRRLREIREQLTFPKPGTNDNPWTACAIVSVGEDGGIGKTEAARMLAKEWFDQEEEPFEFAIEINARAHNVSSAVLTTPEVIRAVLVGLGIKDSVIDDRVLQQRMKVGGGDSEHRALVQIYHEELKKRRVLLLLDNVPVNARSEDRKVVNAVELIPKPDARSRVILTARGAFPDHVSLLSHRLTKWHPSDVAEYLEMRSLMDNDCTQTSAEHLCEAADGIPLLVHLMTALFKKTVTFSWAKLADDVLNRRAELERVAHPPGHDVRLRALLDVIVRHGQCDRSRLESLSTFPMHFDVVACANLWECNLEEAQRVLNNFRQLGLLRPHELAAISSSRYYKLSEAGCRTAGRSKVVPKILQGLEAERYYSAERLLAAHEQSSMKNNAQPKLPAGGTARINELLEDGWIEPLTVSMDAYRFHDRVRKNLWECLMQEGDRPRHWIQRQATHYLALMSFCNDLVLNRWKQGERAVEEHNHVFRGTEIAVAVFRNDEINLRHLSMRFVCDESHRFDQPRLELNQPNSSEVKDFFLKLEQYVEKCPMPEFALETSLLAAFGTRVCDQFLGAAARQSMLERALVASVFLADKYHQAVHLLALGLAHRHQNHRRLSDLLFAEAGNTFEVLLAAGDSPYELRQLFERGIACARGNRGNIASEDIGDIRKIAARGDAENSRMAGLLGEAERHHQEAKKRSEHYGFTIEKGIDFGNLGIIYQIGWEEALHGRFHHPKYNDDKLLYHALQLLSARIDIGYETGDIRGAGNGLGNRASLKLAVFRNAPARANRKEAAVEVMNDYQEAFDCHQQCGNGRGMAASLNNQARAIGLLETGDPDRTYAKAKKLYMQATRIFEREGDVRGMHTCLENLAVLAYRNSQKDDVNHFSEEVEKLREECAELNLGHFVLPKSKKSAEEHPCLADRYGKLMELTPEALLTNQNTTRLGEQILLAKQRLSDYYGCLLGERERQMLGRSSLAHGA